jgi:CheY-like chemotaxis protein
VVDDNVDAADSLALLLASLRYEVHVAYNGIDGLAKILLERPGVAVLDLGMPGLSGFEVASQVRKTFGESIHLVALSGWGHSDAVQRAFEAGFERHITKPANPHELTALIAEFAGREQAPA